LAVYGVEGVLEVYFQQGSFGAAARAALKPCPSRVDSSFRAGGHSDSDLGWKEILSGSGADLCRKAFVSEPAQQLAYCYWPHPSFWLVRSHQAGPGQRWGGGSAGSPLGKEVDDCRELLQQPFPGSRQEGVTEVLRTKTGRPRRGGGWKGVQCFEDIIW